MLCAAAYENFDGVSLKGWRGNDDVKSAASFAFAEEVAKVLPMSSVNRAPIGKKENRRRNCVRRPIERS